MMVPKKIGFKLIVSFSALISIYISNIRPANSFVPGVYEPNKEELKSTSERMGQTAGQLLYFGEIEKAFQLTKLAIKLNPNEDRLWSMLAEIEIRDKNLVGARKALQKAKNLNTRNANYLFREASIDFQEKKIKNSIKLIEKGLSINPKSASGYFQLGNSKIVLKELKDALKAFEEANKIIPDFWQSINNQGLVLYEMGKQEKAILLWKKTISIEADAEPLLALAAANYALNKDKEKSITLAKEALLKNPDYVFASHQKEQLWGENLREATKRLFAEDTLSNSITKAMNNSNLKKVND